MKCLALCVCLISVLLVGCKGGGPNVVGKWKGSVDAPSGGKDDMGAKLAAQLMGAVSLELKSDKTFAMSMVFPIEGTWEQSGNTLTLKATKMMGQDVATLKKQAEAAGKPSKDADKPMLFTVSADGKTLTANDTTGKSATLKFVRE